MWIPAFSTPHLFVLLWNRSISDPEFRERSEFRVRIGLRCVRDLAVHLSAEVMWRISGLRASLCTLQFSKSQRSA